MTVCRLLTAWTDVPTFVLLSQFLGSLGNGALEGRIIIIIDFYSAVLGRNFRGAVSK